MKKINKHRKSKNFIILLISTATFLLFSSCTTVGPNYSPPEVLVPEKWQNLNVDKTDLDTGVDTSIEGWWELFNDPILVDLINRAVKSNLDIREAVLRVSEAKIRRGVSESDMYPSVSSSASGTRNHSSGMNSEFYSAGLNASWEIDLFGGIKRAIEVSDAELASSKESLNDVMLSLTAEVALNYIELRIYQARLAITQANLASQEKSFEIVSWRYQTGLVTELDIERAKSNLEQTRSQLPSLYSGIEQTQNRIAVLLGCNPGSLKTKLNTVSSIPVFSGKINSGIPADILRRRPDLRRAERDIAAQTARIGVAVSDLYPKITLTGAISLESPNTGDFFSSDNLSNSIGPSISWQVFKAGAIKKNVRIQTTIAEQKIIKYRAAVINALEDVENALVSCAYEQDKRESLKKATDAAKKSLEMSQDQYSSGLIDYQSFLETQRTLLSLEEQLKQSEGQIAKNIITLYKALGGGWKYPSGMQM